MGDLKQLFNSRSQVSRGLLDLWRLGRIAGEIASLGDDILARICDTVNELQQLLGGCLIHQCLSYVVSGHQTLWSKPTEVQRLPKRVLSCLC